MFQKVEEEVKTESRRSSIIERTVEKVIYFFLKFYLKIEFFETCIHRNEKCIEGL